jgi:hypothetical protein
MSAIAAKAFLIGALLNREEPPGCGLPQDTNRLDAFPRRLGPAAQNKDILNPGGGGTQVKNCLSLALLL